MGLRTIRSYLGLAVGGLIVVAAIVFVSLQWAGTTEISAFGPAVPINTLVLVLLCAAGGVVVLWAGRLAVRSLRELPRSTSKPAPPGDAR